MCDDGKYILEICNNQSEQYVNDLWNRINSLYCYTGEKWYLSLALGGFSGTGRNSIVECEICNIKAWNLDESDSAFDVHKILSPFCSFIKEYDCYLEEQDKEEIKKRCTYF